MKWRSEKGFFQIIVYLLIFLIFSFTVYACLDMLDLIDVPEEYSVSAWLDKYLKDEKLQTVEANDDSSSIKKAYKEIESKVGESTDKTDITAPTVNDYKSTQANIENYDLSSNDENKYYYNQLNDYSKIIYQEIENNLDNMKSGTYNIEFGTVFNDLLHEETGADVLEDSFQAAVNAINFDKPDLFYLDISKIYLLTTISTKLWKTTYTVQLGCNNGQNYLSSGFSNADDVNKAIDEMERIKAGVKVRYYGEDNDKIRVVHDYLVGQTDYDSTLSKENIYNIYGALINKCTVCEGYARAFKYFMDDLGIPCVMVCGTAVNSDNVSEAHAWNYVKLNGKWYAMDVTWDDPVIIGYGYVGNDIKYKYFLRGSKNFFTNHFENGEIVSNTVFKYPSLNPNDY